MSAQPTALAPRTMPQNQLVTADHAAAVRTALKNSLYPGASDASVDLVLAYCRATGLDPMTKPVHIVPMKVATGRKDDKGFDIKETRDVIMPGIGLYRTNAARTLLYAGCSEPEYGPIRSMKYLRDKWVNGKKTQIEATTEYPEWCRVTVRKMLGSDIGEFTAVEYWLENYASKGDDCAPNAMWEKRPFAQLAKCTEAQALRKAFPEAVGSQPTAEEMEGKEIDVTPAAAAHVAMPTAKSAKAKPPIEHDAREESAEQAKPVPEGEPGIYVTESQKRILYAKGHAAGLDEDGLVNKFDRIDSKNLNDVLSVLTKLVDARE